MSDQLNPSFPILVVDDHAVVRDGLCALLEDVAYGLHSADKRYLHTGLAHLERTFHRLPDS